MFNPDSLVGKQVDQFRLDRFVASGAMGMVFKAFDSVLARTVALKLISKTIDEDEKGGNDAVKEEARKRLIQEAKAAGRLAHPNIVTIHCYGETQEFQYICMEYVDGKTLSQILSEQRVINPEEATPMFEQILLAMEAANQEHIVHRDIKPTNIMITADKRVKVMDFGIAKLPSLALTTTGTVLGTPYYMSPEQITGQKVDIRSDIFSVGAVLYEALTGEKPFQGLNTATLAYKIIQVEPIPPKVLNVHVPSPLGEIVIKAMAKDPLLRYQTPAEMLKDLRAIKQHGTASNVAEPGAADASKDPESQVTVWVPKPEAIQKEVRPAPPHRGVEIPTPPPPSAPPPPKAPADAKRARTVDEGAKPADPAPPSTPPPPEAPTDEKRARAVEGEANTADPAPPKSESKTPPAAGRPAKTAPSARPAAKPPGRGLKIAGIGSLLVVVVIAAVMVLQRPRQPQPPASPVDVQQTTTAVATQPITQDVSAKPAPAPPQANPLVESLIAQAKEDWKKDPVNAQKLLEEAVASDPGSFDASFQLARFLTSRKDFSAAIDQYQRALSINSHSADAYFNLGYIYLTLADYDSAIQNFESCLLLSPPYRDEVLSNLGLSHLRKNNSDQAQLLFKQALDINPSNSVAMRYYVASSASAAPPATGPAGDERPPPATSPGARQTTLTPPMSTDTQPSTPEARVGTGSGPPSIDPSVEAKILQAKEQWQSNPANAQTLLEEAVSLDPDSFEASFQLARLLTFRKDYSAAITQYQNALRLNNQSADAHFNLGFIYLTLRDYDSAIQSFESSAALSPSYKDEVLTNLAIGYWKTHNSEQARLLFQQALSLNPRNELARTNLNSLEKSAPGKSGSQSAIATPRKPPGNPAIGGKYAVTGVNPNGRKYQGTAIVSRRGESYLMTWRIAGKMVPGKGSLSGDRLTVNRGSAGGQAGVVTYTVTPDGELKGVWADGKGSETLVPSP